MNFKEYKQVAREIKKLYEQMDFENDRFSKLANIQCVSSCGGVCCKNNQVEVSPVDLIPLVVDLIENDSIEAILEKANSNKNDHCVFYHGGRCSIYSNRATLCRLFGYSSVYNKEHKKTLSVCSLIKEQNSVNVCPLIVETAPSLVDFTIKVNNLMPAWQTKPMPFNQAFVYAAQRILTTMQYE